MLLTFSQELIFPPSDHALHTLLAWSLVGGGAFYQATALVEPLA